MRIVGLVTEYNPFHNGHLHHLKESKKITGADYSIAVMSGHFLQRGEPAIMDKWTRAKAAVESGVDLVIEIPTLFACSSAEYFAYGAVYLLDQLKIVDSICFGSENGHIDKLDRIASLLLNPTQEFQNILESSLNTGLSFPKSREHALVKTLGENIEFKANNILGIEYIKALKILESPIIPQTIQRIQADYNSLELKGQIASATGIRHKIKESSLADIKDFLPKKSYQLLSNHDDRLIYKEALIDLLLYKIRTTSLEHLRDIHDVSEGLEYKIKKAAEISTTYDQLIENIISKRFTKTRIQRILIKILLDIKKENLQTTGLIKPEYARILAFNAKGQSLIRRIKKASDFPLLTNINKVNPSKKLLDMLAFDIKATNVYNLLYQDHQYKKAGVDFVKSPERI